SGPVATQGRAPAPGGDPPGAAANPDPAAAAPAPAPISQPLPPEVGEPLASGSAYRTPHAAFVKTAIEDALARILLPSLEREIRHELTEEAEAHAVGILARNLRSLLLQPPLRNQRVCAIDPGFRGGCKVAVLDENGGLLEDAVIHPLARKPRDRGGKAPEAAPPTEATPGSPVPTETPAGP